MVRLDLYEFKNLCMEMAELGAANLARQLTPQADMLSQREAYRMHGEARVRRWVNQSMVHPIRSGSTCRSKIIYSRAELLAADKAEKLNNIVNGN